MQPLGPSPLLLLHLLLLHTNFPITTTSFVITAPSSSPLTQRTHHALLPPPLLQRLRSTRSSLTDGNDGPILISDEKEPSLLLPPSLSSSSPLAPLFFAAAKTATLPRAQDNTASAHDPFRYEWGTWVNETSLSILMDHINDMRLVGGAYELLLAGEKNNNDDDVTDATTTKTSRRRFRLGGDTDWDVLLHLLPAGTEWKGVWPTGSWAVVKPLTGVAEVSLLRGPDRNGLYVKKSSKQLRGGADGSTFAGGGSLNGVDCVKYVGGPLRSYGGMSGNTVLLEVVIRPPVVSSSDGWREDLEGSVEDLGWGLEEVLMVAEPPPPEEEEEAEVESEAAVDDNPDDGSVNSRLVKGLGMKFDKVGGLDSQLDDIARRVLASRANPAAAKRLGVSHVRGILLSGPPGCGKTLLARELAQILGAREPQIVNGPEILDRFIGEAERKVRDLFRPAELEYEQLGDDAALHIIILDEMDAIARKRGSASTDTTGVRDSVVNQLLAKMDGVKEASNVLVVGMTNRPELLDPALLRPGRLEVQLRVTLPDLEGRRDILRIHTRQMRSVGALSDDASAWLEDLGEGGVPARTEFFSGAELAGFVRSAASFALARAVEGGDESDDGEEDGTVTVADLERALSEIRPALGKQDEVLKRRYPMGVVSCSTAVKRVQRDLLRFVTPFPSLLDTTSQISTTAPVPAPHLQSLLLVGGARGTGVTALAAWAGVQASSTPGDTNADYVRLITALDILTETGGDEARAAALAERFAEAKEMSNALLILDDVDQLCAGGGGSGGGYSNVMIATLRALLRSPPGSSTTGTSSDKDDGTVGLQSDKKASLAKSLRVIGVTSRSDAACRVLHELFDETVVVPPLSEVEQVTHLLSEALPELSSARHDATIKPMAELIVTRLGSVGCKTALRLAERAIASVTAGTYDLQKYSDIRASTDKEESIVTALQQILDDYEGDGMLTNLMCEVV